MKMSPALPWPGICLPSTWPVRAFRLPAGVDYPMLHDALKARGFVIYAGQGGLSAELFRISTMGDIHAADVERLLAAFDEVTRRG